MLKRLLPRLVVLVSTTTLLVVLSAAPAFGAARPDSHSERSTSAKSLERSGGFDVMDVVEVIWERVRSTIRGDKQGPRDSPGSGVDPNGNSNKPGGKP